MHYTYTVYLRLQRNNYAQSKEHFKSLKKAKLCYFNNCGRSINSFIARTDEQGRTYLLNKVNTEKRSFWIPVL